jgi:DNA-binding CsgD family transcriptional regulator
MEVTTMWQFNDSGWGTSVQANESHADDPGLGFGHMLRVLDEIDYGILVINGQSQILQSNHLARHELLGGNVVASKSNFLVGRTSSLTEQIHQAVEHACRGQRRLLMLKVGDREMPVAFIPLSHPLESDSPSVLVLLSRQSTCDNLAVRMYARNKSLSPTEESVMLGLCRGLEVADIAKENGVAQSTVRSQIKSLREKTGCTSIRRLMQRINGLPPVVPALRIITPMQHNAAEFAHP